MNFRNLAWAVVAALSLSMTSCLQKEDEAAKEKPFAAQDIASELNQAWDYTDDKSDPIGTMKVGNFVYFDNTQQLETAAPRVYLQEGITLMNRAVGTDPENIKNDLYVYRFGYETKSYTGDTPTQSTREQIRTASIPKPTPSPTAQLALASSSRAALQGASQDLQLMSIGADSVVRPMEEDLVMQLGYEKITALPYYCVSSTELEKACQEQLGADTCSRSCSNLESYQEIVDPPALIKNQANCGGLPNCKMTLKRIKFHSTLTVVKKGATQTQKTIFSLAISPEMPFLARVTEFCQRRLFDYNSSKILLTNCTTLKDYQAGSTH